MALSVLVTGGGGVLGRRLRPLLQDAGHEVISCGRTAGAANVEAAWDVAAHDGPRIVCRPDVVVHAAAVVGGFGQSLDSDIPFAEVNIGGTLRVARWCIRNRVRKLVLISSASVYGRWDHRPKLESDVVQPWAAGLYAVTKHCSEQVARLVEDAGCRLSILRLASLYGREYSNSLVQRLLLQGATQQRIVVEPPFDDAFDLLHVEDAARTVSRAVESQRSGLWNVGSGELTTIRRLAEICGHCTGAELHLAAGTANRSRRIINWVDDQLARDELGHVNQRSLEKGVGDVFERCIEGSTRAA